MPHFRVSAKIARPDENLRALETTFRFLSEILRLTFSFPTTMLYRKTSRLFARARDFIALFCVAVLANTVCGQTSILVSHQDEWLPVVAMDDETPLAFVGSELTEIPDGELALQPSGSYTYGSIHFHTQEAKITAGPYFRLRAKASIDRDFENCYILLLIEPDDGLPTKIVSEIPDISMRNGEEFSLDLPINPLFTDADYTYRLYSGGEEISITDENGEVNPSTSTGYPEVESVVHSEKIDTVYITTARAIKEHALKFPPALKGVLEGGYTEAVYVIDAEGKVVEVLKLRTENLELIPPTVATLLNSTYQPATFNEKPIPTTITQRFFFNEVACFAEKMNTVKYPSLDDRNATLIYKPTPTGGATDGPKTKVFFTVDERGSVTHPRSASPTSSPLTPKTIAFLKDCLFLPAIENGSPYVQEISTSIRVQE